MLCYFLDFNGMNSRRCSSRVILRENMLVRSFRSLHTRSNVRFSQKTPTRPRIVAPIVGGLGNQMFILATGIATALRNELDLYIPHYPCSDSCFEPRPVYWRTQFESLSETNYFRKHDGASMLLPSPTSPTIHEMDLSKCDVIAEQSTPQPIQLSEKQKGQSSTHVLRGFFQSSAYFSDFHSQISRLLFPVSIRRQGLQVLHRLCNSKCETTTPLESSEAQLPYHILGIHIRRGDYMKLPEQFHIQTFQNYYDLALRQLYGELLHTPDFVSNTLRIIVFSGDKIYGELFCSMLRSMFSTHTWKYESGAMKTISGLQVALSDEEDYVEMAAMAHCHDLIIANSSFSWWGAYLSEAPRKRVIAPSRWFVGKQPNEMRSLFEKNWIIV